MNRQSTQVVRPSGEKRMPIGTLANPALAKQLLDAFDQLQGVRPGFRPAHAKGLMCSGTFSPSPEAAKLTRASHAIKPSTAVTVRFSDSTGLPNIPDNDPARSGPRGIAIRFHLDEHLHTDIVAHSFDGFPVHTGEEFLEFLRAAAAAGAGQPEAMGAFLAVHPNAKRFVEAPKPIPTSFAREAFFAVTAFKFTNSNGAHRFGRFRIRPETGTEHLSDKEAAAKSPSFLFDELVPHPPRSAADSFQLPTRTEFHTADRCRHARVTAHPRPLAHPPQHHRREMPKPPSQANPPECTRKRHRFGVERALNAIVVRAKFPDVDELKEAEDVAGSEARLILIAPMSTEKRPAGLAAALKKKAASGTAVIWIQPPPPPTRSAAGCLRSRRRRRPHRHRSGGDRQRLGRFAPRTVESAPAGRTGDRKEEARFAR